MTTINFNKDDFEELISQIIGHGIDTNNREIISAARTIERMLDDEAEKNDFNLSCASEGYKFEFNN